MIIVTHEVGFDRRDADRVVVLCDGRILEESPPTDLLDHPQTARLGIFLKRVMGQSGRGEIELQCAVFPLP
jgi:polar amino acid transport system ATP-binding protein